jgi:hypothetical protein
LEVHREISDQLLKEMKELRQRSDTMEKRLRELEVDNAVRGVSNVLSRSQVPNCGGVLDRSSEATI